MTAENKECINEIGEIDEYILTLDNKYVNESKHISSDIKIIPIRIEKNINKVNEDDSDKDSLMITRKIITVAIYYMKPRICINSQY